MEQRDYILREIEKIGSIVNAIRQKIFGGKEKLSISSEHQIDHLKEMLLKGANFDFDHFLNLSEKDTHEYLLEFKGFSNKNIELLAETISEIALNDKTQHAGKYFEKALQLYEICNFRDKTYSLKREEHIKVIKNALQQ